MSDAKTNYTDHPCVEYSLEGAKKDSLLCLGELKKYIDNGGKEAPSWIDSKARKKILNKLNLGKREAIPISFLILMLTDGGESEEFDLGLGNSILTNPNDFLVGLNSFYEINKHIDGILLNLGPEYVDQFSNQINILEKRIVSLEGVTNKRLVKTQEIAINILNEEVGGLYNVIHAVPKHLYIKKELSFEASSTLPGSKRYTYVPSNMVDGSLDTAWCEGSAGEGAEETLTIEYSLANDKPRFIRNLILNINIGIGKNNSLYAANARPSAISISIRRKRDKALIKEVMFPLKDTSDKQSWQLPMYALARMSDVYAELKINSVYFGNKYKDMCISEIDFDLEFVQAVKN